MLYISRSQALVLFTIAGKRKHQFFNGELMIGDPTTKTGDGNAIDFTEQTPLEKSIVELFPTGTNRANKCGLGEIDLTDISKERLFVEAPLIVASDTPAGVAAAGWYRVRTGRVIFKGVTYYGGEDFYVSAEDIVANATVEGDGTYRITFAPDECACTRKEQFKQKHMLNGDEALAYHLWDDGGFTPRNQMTTQDLGLGVGYVR